MTPDELNDELRRAGNYGQRKGEDLVSKEETTNALEEAGATKSERILSPKESSVKVKELLEKLKKREEEKDKKEK